MAEIFRDLAAKASAPLFPQRRVASTYAAAAPLPQEKTEVNGTINVIGDSLSDAGKKHGKYKQKIFRWIPYRWFLHQSPEDQFTNGRVWTYPLQLRMQHQLKEISTRNPLYNVNGSFLNFNAEGKNMAEGGSTAYNYRRFINFFRRIKGFILSFFLNNIEKQSYDIKKEDQGIKPDDLNLVFAGANDFVTVGYCNEGGVSRAIKGIQTSIDLLTTTQKKTGSSNYTKNVVVFTLPDFSKTPRFQGKTEKERAQAQNMCLKFNEELKDLAQSYRYIDFRFGDIYQIKSKDKIDAILAKIKRQGIIVLGKGSHRTVYFVEKGKFVLQPSKAEPVTVKVKLAKDQQKMLGLKQGKVERNSDNTVFLDEWICQLASHAKLDTDVKVFDTAAVFNEVNENPEMYGFTSGCAIYYGFNKCEEPIKGNAVVLTKTKDNNMEVLFFQQGELVRDKKGKVRKVILNLSTELQKQLDLSVGNQAGDMRKVVGLEQKHSVWHTRIIQAAIRGYEGHFGEKIKLADIYTSILLQIKKSLPNQSRIFWDDLHPTATMHFLLELVFSEFFNNHYQLQFPRQWLDDTAILQRKEDTVELPFKSHEAPESFTFGVNNKKAKLAIFSQPNVVAASAVVKKNDNGKTRLLSADKGYYRASCLKPYSRYHLLKAATPPRIEDRVVDELKKVHFSC
ncbi:phosphatidylcholine-sterol acyltransferase [Candidatus Rickettsiella viridis]|uniref:Phosphatidylcholine-sterol acyltransferase n=1 Tax=Candidatus Rickettsiella viridis TaxID=676208 RepID=A0A2Z5UTP9_9COXI|nr:SGNH/GDSL hydrolase family protein [Candidatus Rickettsiella viridis]BBB14828.1 phosphatidylcholine-sterol acyltransferase [Candidatus Rickettsiella viridis]